jgi:hypothetical protein
MTERQKQALLDYAHKMVGEKFKWGEVDCHTMAVDVIKSLTGADHSNKVLGCYNNAQEALAYSKYHGGFIRAILGRKPQRKRTGDETIGDLLLSKSPTGIEQIHVCLGGSVLACDEKKGVTIYPLNFYQSCHKYMVVCCNG